MVREQHPGVPNINAKNVVYAANIFVDKNLNVGTGDADPDEPKAAPNLAMQLPGHLIPRAEIVAAVVRELLAHQSVGLRASALHGIGGIGKTTLASLVARESQLAAEYPDGVLWVSLGQDPQILPGLALWIQTLNVGAPSIWSIDAASSLLRSALNKPRILLVVDDVWDATHAKPFCVGGEGCHVLITTRRANVADECGAAVIEAKPLSPADSLELIARRSRRASLSAVDIQELERAADSVGHLPLAVELIGGLVGRGLSSRQIQLHLLSPEHVRDGLQLSKSNLRKNIDACLRLSINHLRSEDLDSWEKFIILGSTAPGAVLLPLACSRIWGITVDDAEMLLLTFADDALLARGVHGFRLHQLMHRTAQDLMIADSMDGLGISLKSAHSNIVARYQDCAREGQWETVSADGYFHKFFIWHLQKAEDFETIEKLISLRDASGKNLWYAQCAQQDNLQGYVEDLTSSQRLAARMASGAALQIRCALILSSINSSHIGVGPNLLAALVENLVWTPLQAAQRIHLSGHADRTEFNIALVRGINGCLSNKHVDVELAENVRQQSIHEIRSTLATKRPSRSTAKLWGSFISVVGHASIVDEISRLLKWCEDVASQAEFLKSGLEQADPAAITFLLRGIMAEENHVHRMLLLSSVLIWLSGQERKEATSSILAGFKSINDEYRITGDNRKAKDGEQTPEISAQQNIPSPDPWQGRSTGFAVVLRESEEIEQVCRRARVDSLSGPSTSEMELIEQIIRNAIHFMDANELNSILELLNEDLAVGVSRSVFLRIVHQRDVVSGLERKIARGASGPSRDEEWIIELVVSGSYQYLKSLRREKDFDICSVLLRALPRCSVAVRSEICLEFFPEWKSASTEIRRSWGQLAMPCIPARAMLAACGENEQLSSILSSLEELGKQQRQEALIACVSVGWKDLSQAVMAISLRIDDLDEQAGAVLAFVPYMRRDYPKSLLSRWLLRSSVGDQIATLTKLVSELAEGFDAEKLTEVVQAAVHLHSEWWVAEALTLMLGRCTSEAEFMRLFSASGQMQSSDIRARLLGRIARRAVDFGLVEAALKGLDGMVDGPLKWDEIAEVGTRLAYLGEHIMARNVAGRIADVEIRSKAFLSIVTELCALGKVNHARSLIEENLVSSKWKKMARGIIQMAEVDSQALQTEVRSRLDGQLPSEMIAQNQRVAMAREALGSLWRAHSSDVEGGSESHAKPGLAADIWSGRDGNGELLSEFLAHRERPTLLRLLSDTAPLLVEASNGYFAQRVVEAVNDVVEWWP